MDDLTMANAHGHSIRHRQEIEESGMCGCFSCEAAFPPAEIREWTDNGQTALCPRCGIDALIGDRSGFPATNPAFLEAMNRHWF
jgi:uncharacterized paraquat-inducible protein A